MQPKLIRTCLIHQMIGLGACVPFFFLWLASAFADVPAEIRTDPELAKPYFEDLYVNDPHRFLQEFGELDDELAEVIDDYIYALNNEADLEQWLETGEIFPQDGFLPASPGTSFFDPPPFEGTPAPITSNDTGPLSSITGSEAEQQEALAKLRQQTVVETRAIEDKVRQWARANKIEGYSQKTVILEGPLGLPETIEVRYQRGSESAHYIATFDVEGNLVDGPAQTPTGRAYQNAYAFKPPHSNIIPVERRDINGNYYIAVVHFTNGGGTVHFNQDGIAWRVEVFNEDGQRVKNALSPRDYPDLTDPDGELQAIPVQKFVATTCEECEQRAEEHNQIAAEMNRLAYWMNRWARDHNIENGFAQKDSETLRQAPTERTVSLPDGRPVIILRRRQYETQLSNWQSLREQLEEVRADLYSCNMRCQVASDEPMPQLALDSFGSAQDPGSEECLALMREYMRWQRLATRAKLSRDQASSPSASTEDTYNNALHQIESLRTKLSKCASAPNLVAAGWGLEPVGPADFIDRCDWSDIGDTGCAASEPTGSGADAYSEASLSPGPACVASVDGVPEDPTQSPFCGFQSHWIERPDSDTYYWEGQCIGGRCRECASPVTSCDELTSSVIDSTGEWTIDFEIFETVTCNQIAADAPPSITTIQNAGEVPTPNQFVLGKALMERHGDHPNIRTSGAREAARLLKAQALAPSAGGPPVRKPAVRFADESLPMSKRITVGSLSTLDYDAIVGGVQTGKAGFDTLVQIEELLTKLKNGQTVEPKEIKELVDNLDTVRGDRFEDLGQVLNGIKVNANRVQNVKDFLKKVRRVHDFLELANEGRSDPLKAAEAFAEYLSLLSEIAKLVPGMGQFVAKYAEAVASMKANLQTISDRHQLTVDTIREVGTFRDQHPELDLEDFTDDLFEGATSHAGRTPKQEADLENRNRKIDAELDALEKAEDVLETTENCVERHRSRMAAMNKVYDALQEEWGNLPNVRELNATIQQMALEGRDQGEINDLHAEMDYAEKRRAEIPLQAADLREQYAEAKRWLERCEKDLPDHQQAYLQALRDYQGAFAYWTNFMNTLDQGAAAQARAAALAVVDERIAVLGMGVVNNEVRLTVTTACEETGMVLSRRTESVSVDETDEELSFEEWVKKNSPDIPEEFDQEGPSGEQLDREINQSFRGLNLD